MIYGIGTDIVKCARIERMWHEHGQAFAKRILTEYELNALSKLKANHAAFLAKRFAAKEAIAKALGTGFRDEILITQVGIETEFNGKPKAAFYGSTSTYVATLGIDQVQISISDEADYVVAFAIAISA